jgi:hypothetical protein
MAFCRLKQIKLIKFKVKKILPPPPHPQKCMYISAEITI